MRINNSRLTIICICTIVVCIHISCNDKKYEKNELQNEGRRTFELKIQSDFKREDVRVVDRGDKTVKPIDDFIPESAGSLFPVDFERLGLTNMHSLTEAIEMLPEDVLFKTDKIVINMSSIKNFKGIERFENLRALELYNVELEDFTEINVIKNLEWLIIENSIITTMNGILSFQNLLFLSLNGSEIVNLHKFEIPMCIKTVSLSNFHQYKEVTEELSDSIEQLYLEENNIVSLSEIQYLQDKANLQVLYIKGNKIPQEELILNTPYWGKIELIWFLV